MTKVTSHEHNIAQACFLQVVTFSSSSTPNRHYDKMLMLAVLFIDLKTIRLICVAILKP